MAPRTTADVVDILQTVNEDRPRAMRDALPALRELVEGDRTVSFSFEGDDTHLRLRDVEAHRAPGANIRRDFDDMLARTPLDWAAYNPVRPEPTQRNRAVSVVQFLGWDGLKALPAHRDVLVPNGMGPEDQLRVLICDGGSLLAWVGAFRRDPFSRAEVNRLQAVVPALRRRLRLEADLQQGELARCALTASLDLLGVPAWVVTAAGLIRHANALGQQQRDVDRAGVISRLRDAVRRGGDPEYEVTPLTGAGMARHFLVIARRAQPGASTDVAAAASHWQLTSRQADVLHQIAVLGRSNKAIAAALGCSPKAVEFHVTAILGKAGVKSRAALAAEVFALAKAGAWRAGRRRS